MSEFDFGEWGTDGIPVDAPGDIGNVDAVIPDPVFVGTSGFLPGELAGLPDPGGDTTADFSRFSDVLNATGQFFGNLVRGGGRDLADIAFGRRRPQAFIPGRPNSTFERLRAGLFSPAGAVLVGGGALLYFGVLRR